jgi:hypothetical protein
MKTSFDKFMASNAVSPVKTELALVDDLEKLYQDANDSLYKAEIMIVDYNDMANTISSLLNQVSKKWLDSKAKFEQFEKGAKDLGITLSPQEQNRKKIIDISIKEIEAYRKKLIANKVPLNA